MSRPRSRGLPAAPGLLALLALLALGGPPAGAQSPQGLFWESPRVVVPAGARFPAAAAGGGLMVVVWQEFVQNDAGQREVWLTARSSSDARQWNTVPRFAGPFPVQERETPIFSLAVDGRGGIWIAAAAGERRTAIWASRDRGRSFAPLASVEAFVTSVAPSLYVTSRGELLLFATQESGTFLSLRYALSRDGVQWSPFQALVRDEQLPVNFLAHHVVFQGRDYVVCQALRRGERRYQLQVFSSPDGGYNWGEPRALEFGETVDGRQQGPELFSNQRPFLAALPDRIGLVWERQFQARPARVYYLELDGGGAPLGSPQAVTDGTAAAFFPRLLRFRERSYVFYFSGADRIYAAEPAAIGWTARELNEIGGSSYFAYPVELAGRLYVFWENREKDNSRLILLEPDQSVEEPRLAAVNFSPGQASRQELVQVRWSAPADSSGVAGYNYVWSRDPQAAVPRTAFPALLADARNASVRAEQDGTWYFRLAAQDSAGNWSEPATIAYTRDTTPPARPRLVLPPLDPDGYLQSNSFELDWEPVQPGDAAGYAFNLEYRGALEAQPAPPPLPPTANTRLTRVSYTNLDDGIWVFAVAALDAAGNRGEPAVALLPLNKYVPVTYISYVSERRDPLGTVDLTIGGRGFELGGQVSSVLVDRDGAPPYDYSFPRSSGAFRIVSDRLIRDLTLLDVEEGVYRVGVVHPERGLAWSGPVLRLERPGTVKFGDFSFVYSGPWQRVRRLGSTFGPNALLALLAVAFLAVLFLASARRLASLAQEGRLLRREVLAVLRGELPLARKVVTMAELRRRGFGLRWKYTALVMILVLLVVLMVSIPISIYMVDAQRRTMTEGLVQRVDTLLAGLSSTAANNLNPNLESVRQLNAMRDQVASTMSEARYFTLTGYGLDDPGRFDYLWVSSDPEVGAKAEGGRFDAGDYGRVRLQDDIAQLVDLMGVEVNEAARRRVAGLAEEADRLVTEATNLVRTGGSPERVRQLEQEALGLSARIASELQGIRGKARSFPTLDPQSPPQHLAPSYLFYLPVVNQERGQDVYYRGAVRLEVSTESIRAELAGSQRRLLIQSGIIALVAAGLGLIGAFIMAGITVGPIRKLMAGVVEVRDTEDKEQLKDFRIEVRTRDEIGELAAQFTDMTHGLAKAASAQKEMMVGKDIQRMFLPLAKDAVGRKGATAGEQNELLEIFGYYEGAREVSGDFFDYKKLADKYYAMIKCDVSGKGVSAALIMVEVATIFSTYFRGWTPQNPGLKLQPLAELINDMLEEREFKGRFAALTLAILNAQDGKLWLCNAGDNIQHIYRQAQGAMTSLQLPNPPAAGVFPTDLVEMKGGFQQVPGQLASGDVLFLFTDGFEDGLGEVQALQKEKGGQAAEPDPGQKQENPGMQRIYAVIDAVLSRRAFRLAGHHNPLLESELEFDFTACSGSVEEAVLALVSVEKVLRLAPAADAGEKDRVNVDRRVDAFLQKHYRGYERHYTRRLQTAAEGEAVTFTHLREDPQYDDLTILAIRKK